MWFNRPIFQEWKDLVGIVIDETRPIVVDMFKETCKSNRHPHLNIGCGMQPIYESGLGPLGIGGPRSANTNLIELIDSPDGISTAAITKNNIIA